MAIQHTRTVIRVTCHPDGVVTVVYRDKFDDPDDNLLPVETDKTIQISFQEDVSMHDQFVQDVCEGAWKNIVITLPESAEVDNVPV